MKICVFGAGAIGSVVAVRLSRAARRGRGDDEISVIARGAQLKAIREQGLRLIDSEGTDATVTLPASDDPAALGPQDLVIATLKGHHLPAAASAMAPLLGPTTRVVMVLNGVPWWYFYGVDGAYRDRRLPMLDPQDALWRLVGPARVIGCVAYCSAAVDVPGLVRQTGGRYFALGEPTGAMTEALSGVVKLFDAAGLAAAATGRIRDEIWGKLVYNAALNPTSALTGGTAGEIARDPAAAAILRQLMNEVRAVGTATGAHVDADIDSLIENAKRMVAVKSSMLQDMERGRALEVDGILGAVASLGRLTGVPTPTIETVLALVALRGRLNAASQLSG